MGILGSLALGAIERREVGVTSALERWLIHGGGGTLAAGVHVDQETALSSSAIFQGLRILSGSVAMVPLGIYRRMDRGRDLQRAHPAHLVLQDPNPEITAIECRQMLTSFAASAGNGYAEIVFGGNGYPAELWPIPPHRIGPERAPNGALRYKIRTPDGQDRYLPMERVLHLRGFMRGGLVGVDAIARMRTAVGLTLATDTFAASFFSEGTMLSGMMKHPGRISDEAHKRLVKSFEDRHKGPDKAHRVALLEEGMEWIQTGADPEKSQLIEQRQFSVEEAARILNVPPHLLHHLARATFNNIEHLGISFVVYSLGEWYARWEQVIAKRLLLPSERAAGLYAKHNPMGLLRGDHASRSAYYNALFNMGALSSNDIRELEDENPIEGGDTYFVRRDLIPLDQADQLVTPVTEPAPRAERRAESRDRQRLREDFRGLFADTAASAVKKEVAAVRAAVKKAFGGRDSVRLRDDLDKFYEEFRTWVRDRFQPTVAAYAQTTARAVADDIDGVTPEDLDRFVAGYSGKLGNRWVAESERSLRALIAETEADELEAAIEERLAYWESERAAVEANQEIVEAGEAVARAVFAASGIATMRWRANADACPLCQAMDGRTASVVGGAFVREGDTLDPGDGETAPLRITKTMSHPPLHGGCICDIVPG